MALHITAHREGLPTPGMRTPERLLARMRVRVDAQRRRPRERLVARPADVPVMVLLVRRRAGGREIVVVLPGRGDRRDEGG